MLVSGVAELVSLGAVLPFLAVLSNPQQLWQQPIIQSLALRMGLSQSKELVLPATVFFAATAVLAALIRLLNLWLNGRLAASAGSDLSCESYRRTLYQPYGVHLQRNSAAVISVTTNQINRTVSALTAVLQLITALVVALGLLIGLLVIDWQLALVAVMLFGSVYIFLGSISRTQLRQNSERIAASAQLQLKALQEGLGAIRDVLLDGTQSVYFDVYKAVDRPQRQLQARNQFLSLFPRYAVEALGLVTIALLGGLIVSQKGSGNSVIPLLGAFALGAQRLLPALQQIYGNWSALKAYNADLQGVLAMLNQPLPPQRLVDMPSVLRGSISFEGVSFRYGPELPDVLVGLDLKIHRGERIGLIGSTGSGKSTTVDLLMGLLEPTRGRLLVNDEDLHDPNHPDRLLAWRAAIAHVPQNIYLADSSIAENIAFGIPKQSIDMERVMRAAEQAQIHSFVESFPEGYSAFVGERGIRLSGGQRQRIGIARALYKQASVIILDEATSALDTITEEAVMGALEGLSRNLTLVMIAHRLSTVQRCDRVIRLGRGKVLADGQPSIVLGDG